MARVFDFIPKYHYTDEARNRTLKEGLLPGEMWILVQDRYQGNWNHVMTRYCPALPVEQITPQWCRDIASEAQALSGHVPVRIEVHPDKQSQIVFLANEDCWRLFTYKGGNNWLPVKEIHGSEVCDDATALRRRGIHPYMATLTDQNEAILNATAGADGCPVLFLNGWEQLIPSSALQKAADLAQTMQALRTEGKVIYPPQEMIFRALSLTPPEKVKVVILGQDPYHGAGEACGLAFSVQPGIKVPPSLRNIFKVLQQDLAIPDDQMPKDGDLTSWAEHGVLLLNTLLTVEEKAPLSHARYGWQEFTGAIIEACASLPQPVVFLLWGGEALVFSGQKHVQETATKHTILSSHPSPLAANKGSARLPAFMKCHPFLEANGWLATHGGSPVDWRL